MLDQNKTKSMAGLTAISLVLILILAACGGQTNTGNSAANPTAENMTNSSSNNTVDTSNNTSAPAEDSAAPAEDSPAPTEDSSSVDVQAAATVSFAADVLPIFESRCANCHGGERTEGDLNLLTYADVMAGGKDGQVIIPGDAEGSLLIDLVASGKMPKRGPKVTPADLTLIETWIAEGALDN